jgi:plastocyanin
LPPGRNRGSAASDHDDTIDHLTREDVVLTLSRIPVLVALGAALVLGGCGDDDDKSGTTPPRPTPTATTAGGTAGGRQTLELTADESGALKFDKDALSADAGRVEIVMDNPSPVPHNVGVDGNGVDKHGEVVERGGRSTVALDLEAGTYEFYCSVGSHRESGMEGTLTVR